MPRDGAIIFGDAQPCMFSAEKIPATSNPQHSTLNVSTQPATLAAPMV
jgi:hypothetical protein